MYPERTNTQGPDVKYKNYPSYRDCFLLLTNILKIQKKIFISPKETLFSKSHAKNFPCFIFVIIRGLRVPFCQYCMSVPCSGGLCLKPVPNLLGQVISSSLLLFAPVFPPYLEILCFPQAQGKLQPSAVPSEGTHPCKQRN